MEIKSYWRLLIKKNEKYNKCADCIHEWACQAWNVGTIREMDATHCAMYQTARGSDAYFLGYLDTMKQYEKAIDLMAEYIVTLGRVDYYLCDLIPKEIHLKHQPKMTETMAMSHVRSAWQNISRKRQVSKNEK